MPEAIPIVLWSWVPVTLLLFWKLPPARAAVASLLGGWLLLPTARFAGATVAADFPYWIMPACLPSDGWTTKARVVGVALLLGVMAFDPGAWRRFRPSAFDLPILGWCLCPIASGLANGRGPAASVADAAYLAESWGVPYLLGRLYLGHPAGLYELARGFVVGGLAYLPLCATELVAGPVFYEGLYGFHPYQRDGVARYVGSRPIAFLEHGNQLGTWLAMSALVAAWLWRSGQLRRVLGMPGGAVAAALVAQAVASQSAGAVILLVAGLGSIELARRSGRVWPLALAMAVVLAFVGARAANLFDAKALAMRTAVGRRLAAASERLDRRSLGWRLRVEERAARVALRRPALGTGTWDWWRLGAEGERPWGLPGLVLGMYGVAGWALLLGSFLAPIAAFLGSGPPRFWSSPTRAPAAAMAGALALIGLDAILNSFVFLPILAGAGGLVGLRGHAAASSAWLRRAVAPHA